MQFIMKSNDERLLKKADIMSVLKQLDGYFLPPLSSRVSLDEYSEKLLSKASIEYVLSKARGIAGLIAYYCNDARSREAYITYLGLLPEYQGNGAAGKLLDACIKKCMDHNMERIIVYADEMNKKAIRLYESRGFVITMMFRDRWSRGLNSIKLRKDLSAERRATP